MSLSPEPLPKRLFRNFSQAGPSTRSSTAKEQQSASPSESKPVELVKFVETCFDDILAKHKQNNEFFIVAMDETPGESLDVQVATAVPAPGIIAPIPSLVSFYGYPLQTAERILVRVRKPDQSFVMRKGTIRYKLRTKMECVLAAKHVRAQILAERNDAFNEAATAYTSGIEEAATQRSTISTQSEPVFVVPKPVTRASVALASSTAGSSRGSTRDSVASERGGRDRVRESVAPERDWTPAPSVDRESSVTSQFTSREASVDRRNFTFPYQTKGTGKVQLETKYPFWVEQAAMNQIRASCKTAEAYISALLDHMLGLKTPEGNEAARELIQGSSRNGVTSWFGYDFLNALKGHVQPLIDSKKLTLVWGTKEEQKITFLVNKHLGKFKG